MLLWPRPCCWVMLPRKLDTECGRCPDATDIEGGAAVVVDVFFIVRSNKPFDDGGIAGG